MYLPSLPERIEGSPELRRRQALGRGITRQLSRMTFVGLDQVPVSGPVVIAMNHRSAFDGVVLFSFVTRPVNFMVKDEAFLPVVGPVLRSAAQIPVVRQHVDAAAVRTAVSILRSGGTVGIFPEGSRGAGLVEQIKPGVAYLALRSGATVVPVACHGTEQMWHRSTVRRPDARMVFGEPITVDRVPDDKPLNRRVVADKAEEIRLVLADLVATSGTTTTEEAA